MTDPEKKVPDRKTLYKAALLAAVIVATVALREWTDISSYVTTGRIGDTIGTMREWIRGFGVLGPVVFVAAGLLLTIINTPTVLVVYGAVVLYGGPTGLLLSALATLAAANVIFFIGRGLGRDLASRLFGRRVAKMESYSRDQGLMMVVYCRLLFFLAPATSWMLSLTSVSHRDYFLGTLLGSTPHFLVQVWIGTKIVSIIQAGRSLNPLKTPELLVPFAAALLLFLAVHGMRKVSTR